MKFMTGDRSMTQAEIEARVGSMAQLCGTRTVQCLEGAERGTTAISVWNAAGLELWVLPDRGMDIGAVRYRGIPLTWTTKTGYVHPGLLAFGDWPRGFHGGLLATCGLNNVGPACADAGEELEQHGRISRQPASRFQVDEGWQEEGYRLRIQGWVDDADSRGRHLELHRVIELPGDGARIRIEDTVTNRGIGREPCMIQYHMNFGYPLIDQDTTFHIADKRRIERRGGPVGSGYDPDSGFPAFQDEVEMLYYDCGEPDSPGAMGEAVIRNRKLLDSRILEVAVRYGRDTLPHLWRWVQPRAGLYVTAIEPSNCRVKPRSEARAQGLLPLLEPGEQIRFRLEVSMRECDK